MTFLTLQQELASRVGYDLNISADLIKIKRWLNMGVQYICGKKLWPFMLAEEIIQTVADYTSSSMNTTAGVSTVSISPGPAVSYANYYVQTSSSNDWYKITAHIAGTTSMTVSPAAIYTKDDATIKIRKLLYTTTTPLIQVIDMKQMVTPVLMKSLSPPRADFFLPLYYEQSTPYSYVVSSQNSTGGLQFSFVPSPNAAMNVMVRGVKVLSDLSADADIPVIPIPWQDTIINVGAFYAFQSLDDTRATTELQVAEARIADMSKNYDTDIGRHRVMQPIDNESNFGMEWVLPSTFGPEV